MKQIGVSPKVAIPTGILIAAGAALMILDALGVVDVADEIWITLLGAGGVTGAAGYKADPGTVVSADPPPPEHTTFGGRTFERGLTMLEVLVLLLIAGLVGLALVVLT